MFQAWETFYLMTATSAAALVGVMFIVSTLTAEISTQEINRGTVIYQNPTVFHFGAIVAASALLLIPEHLVMVAAILLVLIGLAGLGYSALTLQRTFAKYEFYQATAWDRLFFGVLPCPLYLLMGAGGATVLVSPEIAAELIGAATLLLLLVSIRNAWDVGTFAVRIARAAAATKLK